MSRSIFDYTIGKPDDFIQFVSNDFFAKSGYYLINYKGEQIWRKGSGMITSPSFIKLQYGQGVIHIEAFIKSFGEHGLEGAYGAIPKSMLKSDVDTLVQLLNQPVSMPPDGGQQTAGNPAGGPAPAVPVPVAVYNPTGFATAALICGIVSIIGLFIPVLGVISGIAGINCARKGLQSTARTMAIVGMVLSIIFLVISAVIWLLNIFILAALS